MKAFIFGGGLWSLFLVSVAARAAWDLEWSGVALFFAVALHGLTRSWLRERVSLGAEVAALQQKLARVANKVGVAIDPR